MKQYTVTFVVRATINRPDDDEDELPSVMDNHKEYSVEYVSVPEIIDVEFIAERDLL
jgi:hypothetical protein